MGNCCDPCRNNGGWFSGNGIWIIIAVIVIIWLSGEGNNDCCC